MLQDRGTIKWTSLMLPEHVKMLKQMWTETEMVAQPIVDSQELEVMNQHMLEAYDQQCYITISIYKSGNFENQHGKIVRIDPSNQTLILVTKMDINKTIYLNDIHSLEICEEP